MIISGNLNNSCSKKILKLFFSFHKVGFPITENWLKRNQTQLENGTTSKPEQTIFNAFMELLNWDPEVEFPEVLSNDKERFLKLSQRVLRICGCASTTAICSGISILNQKDDLRSSLIKQFSIILQNVTTRDELVDCMDNVALQVIKVINTYLKENGSTQSALSEDEETTIKTQIVQASKKDSPVYNLMCKYYIYSFLISELIVLLGLIIGFMIMSSFRVSTIVIKGEAIPLMFRYQAEVVREQEPSKPESSKLFQFHINL